MTANSKISVWSDRSIRIGMVRLDDSGVFVKNTSNLLELNGIVVGPFWKI